jgi:hypothetical protein|tara:strand:- start:40 stop:225 length:186 start_codon:yes stop_codon:yes gene_type:complete
MKTFTKKSLWTNQAPALNFEYGEDELLALAIERGFVTEIGEDLYQMNDKYETTDHPAKESA